MTDLYAPLPRDYVDLVYVLEDDTGLQIQTGIDKFIPQLMAAKVLEYVVVDDLPYKIISLAFDGDNKFGPPRIFVVVRPLGANYEN